MPCSTGRGLGAGGARGQRAARARRVGWRLLHAQSMDRLSFAAKAEVGRRTVAEGSTHRARPQRSCAMLHLCRWPDQHGALLPHSCLPWAFGAFCRPAFSRRPIPIRLPNVCVSHLRPAGPKTRNRGHRKQTGLFCSCHPASYVCVSLAFVVCFVQWVGSDTYRCRQPQTPAFPGSRAGWSACRAQLNYRPCGAPCTRFAPSDSIHSPSQFRLIFARGLRRAL